MPLDYIPSISYDDPEILWRHLLSRNPPQVKAAYDNLSMEEQKAVLAHLQRMASEKGWHEEQRLSAQAALKVLQT